MHVKLCRLASEKCEMRKEVYILPRLHNKAMTVSVKTHYPNGQSCREEQELQVELKSLAIVPTELYSKTKVFMISLFVQGLKADMS